MINRRKAVIGYMVWVVGTRLARRAVRKKAAGLGFGSHGNGRRTQMLNRTKSAPQAVALRTAAVAAAVRPIVQRAMNDPELHTALRQAFDTGREVTEKVKGTPPKKAAERLAKDRKLQRRVETSANELKTAVTAVVKESQEEEKKGKAKRVVGSIAVVGGVGAGVYAFMRKRGASQQTPQEALQQQAPPQPAPTQETPPQETPQ
jgi:hypothetical protein